MTDIPQYIIKPNTARIVFSQVVITTLLAFLFYAGIEINISLLEMNIPDNIRILIFAVLALLVTIQIVLTYLQTSKTQYSVYDNRIQIEGIKQEYLMFNSILELNYKKNYLDMMFKTGTLVIGKTKLKAIPNFDQTFVYLKQLVNYSRNQYIQQ